MAVSNKPFSILAFKFFADFVSQLRVELSVFGPTTLGNLFEVGAVSIAPGFGNRRQYEVSKTMQSALVFGVARAIGAGSGEPILAPKCRDVGDIVTDQMTGL
jgi:hypothetical protein